MGNFLSDGELQILLSADKLNLWLKIFLELKKNGDGTHQSFHLSGHTFRFRWTVQDLDVFLVNSQIRLWQ